MNIYLCPICKTELIVSGQDYLETLEEHVTCSQVTAKDKYTCPNERYNYF
jgi:uncharacterized protein YbaR (Trm112 family)